MKKAILLFIGLTYSAINLSCSANDDSNNQEEEQNTVQAHRIEFTTGPLENWVTVTLTANLVFEDDTESTLTPNFDYVNNKISVDIPENTKRFNLSFYIENSSPANMRFYGVEENNIVHQEVTSGQEFEYSYEF